MAPIAAKPHPVIHGLKALAGAQSDLPATTTAELADGSVEYVKAGAGDRAVVLLGGVGAPVEAWALVLAQLAEDSPVLAYNPRGIGASAPPQQPQTATVVVDLLRELLAAAGPEPPYVLVAHGTGGLHANLFARRFPGEVAGVVLLESAHPDDTLGERRLRFVPRAFVSKRGAKGRHRHGEIHHFAETAAQIAQAGSFPDVPLTVVSGTKQPYRWTTSPEQIRRHATRQRELVTLSSIGTHAVAPASGYFRHVADPEIVVRVVRELVAA